MGVNFMSDTLYIQTEENVEVHHPHVYLQDIAKLSCTNSKILNHLRVLPVANLDPDKTGRYVISVMDLINDIQLKEPDLDITHIGEPNFIITYQKEGTVNIVIRWCKVIFVCLATFFGAGFSIMTFNNDVDIPALLSRSTPKSPDNPQPAILFWKSPTPSVSVSASCSSLTTSEE